ncbi:hypothetical protein H6CHR_02187 [Variovorax sp. PBL-H6]|uniref:hypothetical protein n=1 Tax=Variovorax sp. PBL-H6 TaxID=434009 RepID=UPI0013168CFD|nr:hypothetical protein [Variovorax sp. PBL-H6]VTU24408.1 hypothetical protein H6CHR_02187 [Variovorax sp. PBL-H6]
MIFQQQSRAAGSVHSRLSVSASVSVEQTQTRTAHAVHAVHAGFVLGAPLAAAHSPGYKASFVCAFVAYRETVTTHVSIHAGYRFSASARARPQARDPVRALFERTREHPAGAMLFEQTTYRVTTTVLVLYFGYACQQSLAAGQPRGVAPSPMANQVAARNPPAAPAAPSFKPMPQVANVPASTPVPLSSPPALERPVATASLTPVETSKVSDPFDWEKRSVEEMRYRYDVWNALGQQKPARVEITSRASSGESRTVTPRGIDAKGLSFSAEDANGNLQQIPFSDVSRLRVLSA